MSVVATPTSAPAHESKYKSLLKPVKFWQRNSKTAENPTDSNIDEGAITHDYTKEKPAIVVTSSPTSNKRLSKHMPTIALRESGKDEVFKLSTVNDSGVYLPPSPCEDSKRDHWLETEESETFVIPSPDCLTTHYNHGQHEFFTPSVVRLTKTETGSAASLEEDDIPSLLTDSSIRSSGSFDEQR
ncbi:uncharacterized protein BYT42DRAFT_569314 [Radiomyces spectabilis]|uniref:uncharacterized protein n=1 Tax=Radiomyces spectabilis TaxID=64574 RepID=UPI002220D698|nr:uncharacterized protein BYT42DRAFT_569314 [Radiomyces spectabilis]KAI8379591.1 hypothetical protein BYT42DRAFT_569314 [Radiomyces spectabilis]